MNGVDHRKRDRRGQSDEHKAWHKDNELAMKGGKTI